MIRLVLVGGALLVASAAAAMVGGAPPAKENLARAAVMLSGSRGTFCSGVALTRDLVLTAAHCVLPGADYKLVELAAAAAPSLRDIARIERHPEFDPQAAVRHRVSADIALLKLADALRITPALLAPPGGAIVVGDRFVVAGYGVTLRGDGRTGGTLRTATLVATGQPGSLQVRLVDPDTRGERPGLGACTGDSGAPVLRDRGGTLAVVGVVSWSTGPGGSDGCGGLTGMTPLGRYHGWIVARAAAMGSPLPP